jgi:nucleotide-binding universal stress UspA family protein
VEQRPRVVVGEMGAPGHDLEGLLKAQTKQAAEDLVAKTAETLRTKNVKDSTAVLRGNLKTKILDAAKQWRAELIVLGSLGRGGLERYLRGSVSDAVACHAHCSVEFVRICPGL